MTHNPYAPPGAVVADAPDPPSMPRPWQVSWASWMCVLSVAAGIPDFTREVVTDTNRDAMGVAWFVLLGIVIAVFAAFAAWVIPSIYRGHRWARVAYCVYALLGILGLFSWLSEKFAVAWYFGVLSLLGTALDLAVVVLLFLPAANAYFDQRRARPWAGMG